MAVSKMNKRIEVFTTTTVSDAGGNTETRTSVGVFWAAVEPLSQARSFMYGMTENFKNYKITMRYLSTLTTKETIDYNGKTLTISSILNKDEKNIEMELIASENE